MLKSTHWAARGTDVMSRRPRLRSLVALCSLCLGCSLVAAELEDPTRPASKSHSVSPTHSSIPHRQWILESTLVAEDRRVAVINGKLVSEGESVDGAQVLEIRQFIVLVKTPNRKLTLQMLPTIVERNP